ncbi:flagellar motor protein MotB [Iodidimonas gelatinilytica]|uniref:Flagellar motor protein MotB n=1 Tax=Iodidimonas gelatinilytica TaxID=1236966 RepID=A0A5A7N0I8_9PROT|nr:peptidoglycan -binding protein [Iodidimonas gelatinilytica]GEQ98642.1 flagellar motor protein MotB [Iodidimonas gelatinilytica]GER01841.1 flagellar motor protein MotB [Iodidimonas gelatinilytica]
MSLRTARRRNDGGDDTWPGFVDALSTLLLVLVFLLSIFALAQFFLGAALSGRDAALERLRDQVAELGQLLNLERQSNADLRDSLGALSANLQTIRSERDDLSNQISGLETALNDARNKLAEAEMQAASRSQDMADLQERYQSTAEDLAQEKELSAAARNRVAELQASLTALRQQLARLEAALDASEQRDKEQQATIVDLGRRLNVALAQKVEELAGFRSEFFGRLREVLGQRSDIRIEGDRFIFQSELLFASGSAALGFEGRTQMRQVAQTLLQITEQIPSDIDWVLRVDGHTDKRPISTAQFSNNWELSAARAISVVQFLISEGVPPQRLVAAGFGEYQPIAQGDSAEDLRRNRRIEMRFTQR